MAWAVTPRATAGHSKAFQGERAELVAALERAAAERAGLQQRLAAAEAAGSAAEREREQTAADAEAITEAQTGVANGLTENSNLFSGSGLVTPLMQSTAVQLEVDALAILLMGWFFVGRPGGGLFHL